MRRRNVLLSAEKLRLQEELFRLRSFRKDNETRREHLLNKAKVLQARASKFKAKVRHLSQKRKGQSGHI